MKLRPYQVEAVQGAFNEWKDNQSTLIVIPTGGGKTTIFCEISKRFLPQRTMVLAHREELIFQAAERMKQFGIKTEIEMAELNASTTLFGEPQCVVATVQTMLKRKDRFDPSKFGLVVVDEAHHSIASSYVTILNHFKQNPDIRILGVTATPDRADEEAMGKIFDSVAYDYEILDAMKDGWLVPVEQRMVHVSGLDFTNVKTTAGDLNGADLSAVMEQEENVHGVIGPVIEIIGDRQAILFASSVVHAEKACEIFNRHKPGMAIFICGETNKDDRRERIKGFKEGKTQILCNVGVATEGADFPNVSVIGMARPTESRSLYAQMIGRALRPLPGLVDPLETSDERKQAIASSIKPSALILDFVGNSGRHKLVTTADILGGKVSDEAVQLATKRAKESQGAVRMVELLEEEEERLKKERERRQLADAARRARLVAKVNYSTSTINPFDLLDISPAKERGWHKGKVLSEKQKGVLLKMGVDPDKVNYAQGKQLIVEQFRRWDKRLATVKQVEFLKRSGVPNAANITMKEASAMFYKIKANHWKFNPSMLTHENHQVEESVPF